MKYRWDRYTIVVGKVRFSRSTIHETKFNLTFTFVGFEVNTGTEKKYDRIHKLGEKESFAISIRGSTDGYIALCEGENYATDLCYWIIIGGWGNTKSMIRKCPDGLNRTNTCGDLISHEVIFLINWLYLNFVVPESLIISSHV